MATVAEMATMVAFSLLAELPPTDELTYNRRLTTLWDWIMIDLFREIFAYGPYGLGFRTAAAEEAFVQLMNEDPIDAAAVEMFLRSWLGTEWLEKNLRSAVHNGLPYWRDRLKPKKTEDAA